MTVTVEKIAKLMDLQDKLNICTNGKDWKSNEDLKWLRASWIEAAELMDWCGYKWWKKQEFNKTQAHIELVDIFHFLLSQAIVEELKPEELLYSFLEEDKKEHKSRFSFIKTQLEWVEELSRSLLNEGVFYDYYTIFSIVCDELGLGFDELYELYICKNVLNIFRQDHGYKEGTYIKEWKSNLEPNGFIEDNVYLEMFINEARKDKPSDMYSYLYERLDQEYINNL